MREYKNIGPNKNEIYVFDSMSDVVRYTNGDNYHYHNDGGGFAGEDLPTWDAVLARCQRDWAEGMYTVQQYVDKLKDVALPPLKDHKRKTQFSETDGDEVDLDRLRSGQPFFRTSTREDSTGSRNVTIMVDMSANCYVDHLDILWRGAAAVALACILEEKGYRCEVWAVQGTRGLYYNRCSRAIMSAVNLKRGSDPMDASTLINSVAGWFYRTVIFTQDRTFAEKANEECNPSLGGAYTMTADDLDVVTPDDNRIFISGVYNFDAALSVVTAELEKLAE